VLADAEQLTVTRRGHGDDRGDEPPAGLRSRDERRHALAEAKGGLFSPAPQQLQTGQAAEFDAGIDLDLESSSVGEKGVAAGSAKRHISCSPPRTTG